MSTNISTEKLYAAVCGAATQCNKAYAETLKAMLGHAIEIAESMNRQATEIYNLNMNMSLHNKKEKEPEKSVKDDPNNIRATPRR
jgi:hypothetical protein